MVTGGDNISVYYYDDAIVNTFRNIFSDGRITILPSDKVIRFTADISNDSVKLPLISLSRIGYSILENYNGPKQRVGLPVSFSDPKMKGTLQAIKIRIDYQIDIWTRDRLTNDNISRELIFYLINNPTFSINIPYNINNLDHKFNLFIDTEVEDNSDIVSHDDTGQVYRTTISVYTDDAHLFNSSVSYDYNIKLKLEGVDTDGKVYDI